jgi:hypothetical protein
VQLRGTGRAAGGGRKRGDGDDGGGEGAEEGGGTSIREATEYVMRNKIIGAGEQMLLQRLSAILLLRLTSQE